MWSDVLSLGLRVCEKCFHAFITLRPVDKMVKGGVSLVPSLLMGGQGALSRIVLRMLCGRGPLNLLLLAGPLDKVWKINLYQDCCYWFLGCARIETRLYPQIKGTGKSKASRATAGAQGRLSTNRGVRLAGGNRREVLQAVQFPLGCPGWFNMLMRGRGGRTSS